MIYDKNVLIVVVGWVFSTERKIVLKVLAYI